MDQDRDAFVLVLIDGDGTIFDDNLIAKGEAGGKEAAGLLWNALTSDVHRRIPNLGSDYKVVARIYANLKGLGEACNRAGILEHPMLIEDFARGFTGSKQLFDFVDVGTGKDRADDKISGTVLINKVLHGAIADCDRNIQTSSIRLSLPTYLLWLLTRQWICSVA